MLDELSRHGDARVRRLVPGAAVEILGDDASRLVLSLARDRDTRCEGRCRSRLWSAWARRRRGRLCPTCVAGCTQGTRRSGSRRCGRWPRSATTEALASDRGTCGARGLARKSGGRPRRLRRRCGREGADGSAASRAGRGVHDARRLDDPRPPRLRRRAAPPSRASRRRRSPPGAGTQRHHHAKTEEIYVVLSGSGRMEIEGEDRDVAPGDAILIPPGARHEITAERRGRAALPVLLCAAVLGRGHLP